MISNKSIILAVLLVVALVGCAVPTYNVGLSEVERPANATKRYGEHKIVSFKEGEETKYRFEDEMVEMVFFVEKKKISFSLLNKTKHSIKIVWDESVYIDQNGRSNRVMHQGVKYIKKSQPQPPSIVAPLATIEDVVIPADNVHLVGSSWRVYPLLPYSSGDATDAKNLIGKKLQVLLALQTLGVVSEYIFSFTINDVQMIRENKGKSTPRKRRLQPGLPWR